jgi:very-short-patch-repair endonuclease
MALRREKNESVLRARLLRRNLTLPEVMLWRVLRQRPDGLKFRLQHPIGRCIVDFYCAAAKLVIEINGEAHSMGERPERDLRRDAWLKGRGFRVIRFSATDVIRDLESVVTGIRVECRRQLPLHHLALRDGSPPHSSAAGRN